MAGELNGSKVELTGRSWGSGWVWSSGSMTGRDSSDLEEGSGGVYAGEEARPGYL